MDFTALEDYKEEDETPTSPQTKKQKLKSKFKFKSNLPYLYRKSDLLCTDHHTDVILAYDDDGMSTGVAKWKHRTEFETDLWHKAPRLNITDHPNILKTYDSFEDKDIHGLIWVMMPFMFSGSLRFLLKECYLNGLEEYYIVVILKHLLLALVHIHGNKQFHGAIKPSKILFDDIGVRFGDGEVRLSDDNFSLLSLKTYLNEEQWSSVTRDRAGTPNYWIAPELIEFSTSHNVYDMMKTDIWSLGITALEMAHARPPLTEFLQSKESLYARVRQSSPNNKQQQQHTENKLSKSFTSFVLSCLNQDPSQRPSAEELLKHDFFHRHDVQLEGYRLYEMLGDDSQFSIAHRPERVDFDGDSNVEGLPFSSSNLSSRVIGWRLIEEVLMFEPIVETEIERA